MFFANLNKDTVAPDERTIYPKGDYVMRIKKISYYHNDNKQTDNIIVRFKPIAKINLIDGTVVAEAVSGSDIAMFYNPYKNNGDLNEEFTIKPLGQMVWAATGLTSKEEVSEEYDPEPNEDQSIVVESWAEKLSALELITIAGSIGINIYQGKESNRVGNYQPVSDLMEEAMVEADIDTEPPPF